MYVIFSKYFINTSLSKQFLFTNKSSIHWHANTTQSNIVPKTKHIERTEQTQSTDPQPKYHQLQSLSVNDWGWRGHGSVPRGAAATADQYQTQTHSWSQQPPPPFAETSRREFSMRFRAFVGWGGGSAAGRVWSLEEAEAFGWVFFMVLGGILKLLSVECMFLFWKLGRRWKFSGRKINRIKVQ